MLTGNLVLVKTMKGRIIPKYLNPEAIQWLELAEGLLVAFREGVGLTRGEIAAEVDALIGEGAATLAPRGLAKLLEDRGEFEVVSDVPPDRLRERVFTVAAEQRLASKSRGTGRREPFRRDEVLESVAAEFGIEPARVSESLFADLKDEARMLKFQDLSPRALLDRYNEGLAQSVLLRSVLVTVEVRKETPSRYRQLFRWLKFHRLLARVERLPGGGYSLQIDGPMSLFSSTTKYGLQMALFLPAILQCEDFRLDAELRWGPRREPRWFHLETGDGLRSHRPDTGQYTPPEVAAFLERFRQVAPDWEVRDDPEIVPIGPEGVWVPDYRLVHRETGLDVYLEILGFWKGAAVERLLRALPEHGPERYLLMVSEKLKVDEGQTDPDSDSTAVLRFKEIPNASDLAVRLAKFPGAPR